MELIVVITILAILGTIGIVSFSSYNSNARDSTRIEDLSNIQKSLSITYTTTGNKYPIPDSGVPVYNNGVLVQTQGYAGKNTLTYGKFNGVGQDPLDNQYYTYSVPSTQTGMELMAYLENSSNLTLTSYDVDTLASTANADSTNYSIRYPAVKGDPIGILVASGTLMPLQMTGTGIEIQTNNTLYTAYVSQKISITAVGDTLYTAITTAGSGMTNNGSYVTNGVCTGLPANAVYYGNGSSYALVNANFGTSLSASFVTGVIAANTCQFTCANGYVWNGSACLIPSVNGACTGLPTNAAFYGGVTSYTLSGAAVGTSFAASFTGGTLIPNSCMFNCTGGYGWNGSSCATPPAYNSSLTYTSGQAFTWSGATISVT